MKHLENRRFHQIFILSVVLKGLNSILEILAGVLLMFTGTLTTILLYFTKEEPAEDPTDFLVTHIQGLLPYLSTHTQFYISFYLISHGIIKIILVINLFRKKIWSYPATIIILFLFIIYQIYRISFHYSTFLVLLTILDVVIIYLTWCEYSSIKRRLQEQEAAN